MDNKYCNDSLGPCQDYRVLDDKWRLLGTRPYMAGIGYHCDNSLQEGWYRFQGPAGSQLADEESPPGWEECGTSQVAWLQGEHPAITQGTVSTTLCLAGVENEETSAVKANKSNLLKDCSLALQFSR